MLSHQVNDVGIPICFDSYGTFHPVDTYTDDFDAARYV